MAKIVVDTYQNTEQINKPLPVVDSKPQAMPLANPNQSKPVDATTQTIVDNKSLTVTDSKALPVVEQKSLPLAETKALPVVE